MTNNQKQENNLSEQKNNLIEKETEAVKILHNGWSRQIILTGPPGTSKTYSAKRIIGRLMGLDMDSKDLDDIKADLEETRFKSSSNKEDNSSSNNEDESASNNKHNVCWDIVQFHPSYNYEDFVRGIEVIPNQNSSNPSAGITYKTVDKILGKMAKQAMKSALNLDSGKEAPLHVLIIDEINRAPLASVLGELIYALEYRGDSVTTPYTVTVGDSQHLVIPDNLIIIGTMNTADRSIGSIDYAVRRRFTFINLPPDEEVIKDWYGKLKKLEQNKIADIIDMETKAPTLFNAVGELFNGKKPDDKEPKVDNPSGKQTDQKNGGYMDPEFYAEDVQIGHTYFLAKSDEELKHKFIYKVIPVLKEYIKDGILINNPCLKFKITTSPTSSPTNTTDKPIYLSESFNKIKGEIESCWSKIYVG
jgi:hypothetical protein